MVQIGEYNDLKVVKFSEYGLFLDGAEDGEILLPSRYVEEKHQVGDTLRVFIYRDSEDRLVATTETPLLQVGQINVLKVNSTSPIGAFLGWGLGKDLLLPFAEQTHRLKLGQNVVVSMYVDKSDRLVSTMRVDKYLSTETPQYKIGDEVDVIVYGVTDLGYKALVGGKHPGLLYKNENFQKLAYGQQLKAYVKKVRDDNKIDLISQKIGHTAGEDIEPWILEKLKKSNGYLPINDKTSAELIYEMFGVSKKKYKIALGGLYKKRLIVIEEDGIRLVK